MSRGTPVSVEIDVSPAQVAEIIQKWAIDEMGFKPEAIVRILSGGKYLSHEELSQLTPVAAKVSENDEPASYEADPVEAMELVEQSLP